jgi:polyhydroxyalkanoate synthesis regulator phasin
MAEVKEVKDEIYNPLAALREMRDIYLDAVSKTMVQAVNTEDYAKATGAMLEGYLAASAPLREEMEKMMVQALQHLGLPTRQEVASLAERFTNVEMRLDDLDAKLDRMLNLFAHMRSTPRSEHTDSRKRPAGNRPS